MTKSIPINSYKIIFEIFILTSTILAISILNTQNANAQKMSCVEIYRSQENQALKSSLFSLASPLTNPVMGSVAALSLVGDGIVESKCLIGKSKSSLGTLYSALAGIVITTTCAASGAIVVGISLATIPYSLGKKCPLEFKQTMGISKIANILEEVQKIIEKESLEVEINEENLPRNLSHMFKKLKARSVLPEYFTPKRFIKVIKRLSDKGTLCPEGTVYSDKHDFNSIVLGFMDNKQYSIPTELYKKTRYFAHPLHVKQRDNFKEKGLFLEEDKNNSTFKKLNNIKRFEGKEKFYSGQSQQYRFSPRRRTKQ